MLDHGGCLTTDYTDGTDGMLGGEIQSGWLLSNLKSWRLPFNDCKDDAAGEAEVLEWAPNYLHLSVLSV